MDTEKMKNIKNANFNIGQVVKHKYYPFRGVVFDIDPEYANTEEYLMSIPQKNSSHQRSAFLSPIG
jgi:heat shock protein HspQ